MTKLIEDIVTIIQQVGFGTAHDEYVPFKIQDNSLLIGDYKLAFDGNLHVEFVKVCAKLSCIV